MSEVIPTLDPPDLLPLPLDPETAVGADIESQWMRYMRQGDFEHAWELSDRVLRARSGRPNHDCPRHLQSIWTGESLVGKRVLVRCYHGLGDTIQFIRYAPLLKAIAAEVIVWAQPSLIPLLQQVRGIDSLLPLHEGTPDAVYDCDVEIMELPHIFRTTLDTLPCRIPYLHVEPAELPRDGKLAVGIVWKSGDWDDRRSVPFHMVQPLADVADVTLHVLQRDAIQYGWRDGFGVLSVTESTTGDAQVIRALDLLISVDTMTAHLAGALGAPVWLLLPAQADWRWMEGREDSPWYPTMRLFRQTQPGDWPAVISRVAKELTHWANQLRDQIQ